MALLTLVAMGIALWAQTMVWVANVGSLPIHVARHGETLTGLARERGCSTAVLRAANPGLPRALAPGDEVRLPPDCRVDGRTDRLVLPTRARTQGSGRTARRPAAAAQGGDRSPPADRSANKTASHRSHSRALPDITQLPGPRVARAQVPDPGNFQAPQGLRHLPPPASTSGDDAEAGRTDAGRADAGRTDASRADAGRADASRADVGHADADVETAERSTLGLASRTGTRVRSLGRPQAGGLRGGVALPEDTAYHLRHPDRAYGMPHVVAATREVIAAVRKQYPRLHRLAIGDLSGPRGGYLSGHRSHQSGRDVDLGFYFERTPEHYPQRFVPADAGKLHLGALWALIDGFYRRSKRPGGPTMIFLDYRIQARLVRWARRHGVSKSVLGEVFQYPEGRGARKAFVRHEPAHHDHLHVRFGCAPKDSGCR